MTEKPPVNPHETPPDHQARSSDIGRKSLNFTPPDILVPNEKVPFENWLALSRDLYQRIGITPPSLEEFEQSGVDFDYLSRQWNLMMQDGHDPVVLFAKVNPSVNEACALFAHLRADPTIKDNPLRRREIILPKKNVNGEKRQITYLLDGLDITSAVREKWEEITVPAQGEKTADDWSVRIVASTSNDIPHARGTYESETHASKDHPTIPEYLTLQAMRIHAGEQPLDSNQFVWLGGGSFTPSYLVQPRAPFGTWNAEEGCIVIGHDRVIDNGVPAINYLRPARSAF